MSAVDYILIGKAVFFIAALVPGTWSRADRNQENAENSSRVMHFFFFAGLVASPRHPIITGG